MNISLAAEPVFSIRGFALTNSAFTTSLMVVFLVLVAFLIRIQLRDVPRRFQAAIESMYEFLLTTT